MPKPVAYYAAAAAQARQREIQGTATQSEIDSAHKAKKFRNLNWIVLGAIRKNLDLHKSLSGKIDQMNRLYREYEKWIDSYEDRNGTRIGRALFRWHWKKMRLWIGLQDRLFIEQVLYDRGGFYRGLVSGFRPIDK